MEKQIIPQKEQVEKLKWRRISIGKYQSWLLTPKEIGYINVVYDYVASVGSCPITHLYKQNVLRQQYPKDETRRLAVKYALMFLWKRNKITIKCNNGMKIIKIKKS